MKDDKSENITRVVRVSRIFVLTPVSVVVHTEDGRREKIRVPDWEHINADTGGLTESGWKFIEAEIAKIFGNFEWATPRSAR